MRRVILALACASLAFGCVGCSPKYRELAKEYLTEIVAEAVKDGIEQGVKAKMKEAMHEVCEERGLGKAPEMEP